MPYQIENLLKIIDHIKPLYILIVSCFLLIYVVLSWLGRINKRLKNIFFSDGSVDTVFHLLRYTIGPTLCLILLLNRVVNLIKEENTNWKDFGNKNAFLIFILLLLLITISSIFLDLKKRGIFGYDPQKLKSWIPFIVVMSLLFITITATIILIQTLKQGMYW